MARASTPRIPGATSTDNRGRRGIPRGPRARRARTFGLGRSLRRWLTHELRQARPILEASARAAHADRYRKHFFAFSHACLLLFHGLTGRPSLRQSYAEFADQPALLHLSGLASGDDPTEPTLGLSSSAFADSNTTRPAAFLHGLATALMQRVRQAGPRHDRPILLQPLHLVDSTFLHLSLKLARWLPASRQPANRGVRIQVEYAPAWDLPEQVVVTTTRQNDVQRLTTAILDQPARLAALAEQTLVFDLGFSSHARFAKLRRAQVHFVTRCHPQARLVVEADLPCPPPQPLGAERIIVQADQRVTVGSTNNRAGAVLTGLRRVTAQVEPTAAARRQGAKAVAYQVLTDRWDLTATEVVLCYLWRWQIELFFRWLKSHVRLIQPLGFSENAIHRTIWLSLVVHLLAVLAAQVMNRPGRSPTVLAQLDDAIRKVTVPVDREPPALQPARQLRLPGFDAIMYPLLVPT